MAQTFVLFIVTGSQRACYTYGDPDCHWNNCYIFSLWIRNKKCE